MDIDFFSNNATGDVLKNEFERLIIGMSEGVELYAIFDTSIYIQLNVFIPTKKYSSKWEDWVY